MACVGLMINQDKPTALDLGSRLISWLGERSCRVIVCKNAKDLLGRPGTYCSEEAGRMDFAIVLGGDGTLLHAARSLAPFGIPMLGINLGQLGFLTEVEVDDLFTYLELVLEGKYAVDERMMLQAEVIRGGKVAGFFNALNDVVVMKGAFARMIWLQTYVDDELVDTYPADGIIVSSPTGSTAYSLSAGGPIATPELNIMIVTPICPHTLYSRPLVISSQRKVRVILQSEIYEVMLTLDGQYGFELRKHDEIRVCEAPYKARLIRLKHRKFFEVMREKLRGASREEPI